MWENTAATVLLVHKVQCTPLPGQGSSVPAYTPPPMTIFSSQSLADAFAPKEDPLRTDGIPAAVKIPPHISW